MSEDTSTLYKQALVAVMAAANAKGVSFDDLYHGANELLVQEDSKIRFMDRRDIDEVAAAISLAQARIVGLEV
ncbi:hypothetical protein ALQ54_02507 [Pseudomonas syringae]|uniref:hypothetical protein n=1 Tax=Pseudomonas syringae TaxID=317 RepID=UPI000EFCA99C|nr:hypothetical protein [Pseudomonas syringae]RMN67614.1 hypothetical protein ALQ54_02507 [Pseudomonas syringae]